MKRILALAGVAACFTAFAFWAYETGPVHAQSGSRSYGGSGSRAIVQPVQKTFEQRLWDWLENAQYTNWAPAPGQNSQAYKGTSPHGAFLKMYLNRKAVAESATLPHGSVLIKENFGADGKTLMAVTVMYRSKGFDPENNDWYYVKYQPNGTVAQKEGRPLAGRVKGCVDCHSGADGDDFAFFNDK